MQTARNGAVELAYRTAGPPSGAPLLLINGNETQMVHLPDDFVTALIGRGFRVATFDNRDAGLSTHCADLPPYDLRDLAADAVAVLDALGWGSAHVFGVSLGGMIGQVMAVHHAERVCTLTSVASAPTWSLLVSRPRPGAVLKIIGIARRAGEGREAAVETALAVFRVLNGTRYPLDEQWARTAVERAYDIAHDPAGGQRQRDAAKASGDRRAELGRVVAPTLVVHGDADPAQSPHAGRATARAIPGARLLVLPGVGHGLPPAPLWPTLITAMAELAGLSERPGELDHLL
jgi:pimeloyl-ACP methyl ester carboxylesterase